MPSAGAQSDHEWFSIPFFWLPDYRRSVAVMCVSTFSNIFWIRLQYLHQEQAGKIRGGLGAVVSPNLITGEKIAPK